MESSSIPRELEQLIDQANASAAGSKDPGKAYSSLASYFYDIHAANGGSTPQCLKIAIDFAQKALDATQDGDERLAGRLDRLSSLLYDLYMLGGGDNLLREAIQYGRRATQVEAHGTREIEDRADFHGNLSDLLQTLFQLNGGLEVVDEAIKSARIAANECSEDRKPIQLNTLANALSEKYQHGGMTDNAILTEALEAIKMALRLDSALCGLWITAANLRIFSYQHMNQEDFAKQDEDLQSAKLCVERAVQLAADEGDHPKSLVAKSIFCKVLVDNHGRYGHLEDLNKAITIGQEVMNKTDQTYPHLVRRSQILSHALSQRFEREGDIRDLEEAIEISRHLLSTEAFRNAPSEQAMHYNNLALRLLSQSSYSNSKTIITQAMEFARLAIQCAQIKQERFHCLTTLAATYYFRFEIIGAEADIDESIRILDLVKSEGILAHEWRAKDFLARAYTLKFERANNLHLLDSAIGEQSRALQMHSKGPLGSILSLNASLLRAFRSSQVQDIDSLNAAIIQSKEVLEPLKWNDPNRPGVLKALARLYGIAYQSSGDEKQLELALETIEKARTLAGDGHSSKAAIHNTLGFLLSRQYMRTENHAYINDAIRQFQIALSSAASSCADRIHGGRQGGLLLGALGAWDQAVSMLDSTIKLLPQLTPRELDREDQQFHLTDLSSLSGLAASTALNAGWSATDALSLFEAGRGLIAAGSIDLRSDMAELERKAPDLARKYSDLRYSLRAIEPSLTASLDSLHSTVNLPVNSASRRLKVSQELTDLEESIRDVPGLRNFKQPQFTDYESLMRSDRCAAVAFNVNEIRSDAFLVTNTSVRVLALPKLDFTRLQEVSKVFVGPDRLTDGRFSTFHKRNSELRLQLGWLWDSAVKPVLEHLGFLSSTKPIRLPRITWISSGILGVLPLHAAGRSWNDAENAAFHVISSYTPNFNALRWSQEKNTGVRGLGKVLILTMPHTIGWHDLNVADEAKDVKEKAIAMGSEVEVVQYPSREKVLQLLDEFSTIFVGCHGETDPVNPSNNAILLADAPEKLPEKLTVRDIATRTVMKASLIYLSACSTAENPSQGLMDEVIHLASTLQSIGFPHIIGTLWQVEDETAGLIARVFFDKIRQQLSRSQRDRAIDFGLALHEAVEDIRTGDAHQYGWRENISENVTTWAPFVHIGS